MPLAKGLLLIATFALTWGVFAGMNVALLRVIADLPLSALSTVASLVLAFIETLVLVELVDRRFLRGRTGARRGASIVSAPLERVPLFRGGDPLLLNQVSQSLRPRIVEAGQTIIEKGDPGTEMFLICRGEVEVLDGNGQVKATLRAGDCFGEVALLLSEPWIVTVRAKTLSDLFVLEKGDFSRILRDHQQFATTVQEIARERYNKTVGTEQLMAPP